MIEKSDTTTTQNISLEFDPYVPWNRGILRGIEAYANNVQNWRLLLHRMIPGRRIWIKNAAEVVDGIISTGEKEWAQKTGIPLVRFATQDAEPGYPVVEVDFAEVGKRAAQNLIENGYKSLIVFETLDPTPQDFNRLTGFLKYAIERKVSHQKIQLKLIRAADLINDMEASRTVIEVFHEVPKPIGLFARNLSEVYILHSLMLESGLDIPNEVGLIAGGNDRDLLSALQPPVTSVSRNSYEIGYRAAEVLHEMLQGKEVEPLHIVPPGEIVDRGSTQLQRIGDDVVERARKLIRQRIGEPINLDKLALELGVSGRSLRRRFQAALRHSPVREVQLARIETAKDLLIKSRMSILEIAHHCGFAESCQLSSFFKKETGMTATAFRSLR